METMIDIHYVALQYFMEERAELPWPWNDYTRGISKFLGDYKGTESDCRMAASYFTEDAPAIVMFYLDTAKKELNVN